MSSLHDDYQVISIKMKGTVCMISLIDAVKLPLDNCCCLTHQLGPDNGGNLTQQEVNQVLARKDSVTNNAAVLDQDGDGAMSEAESIHPSDLDGTTVVSLGEFAAEVVDQTGFDVE